MPRISMAATGSSLEHETGRLFPLFDVDELLEAMVNKLLRAHLVPSSSHLQLDVCFSA